jgi:hypothetical protein
MDAKCFTVRPKENRVTVKINGQAVSAKPPNHIVRIKNLKWREGDPENTRYFMFPLPQTEGVGVEIRTNALGYSIYFTEMQHRNHPLALELRAPQRRTLHTECFFQLLPGPNGPELQEILNHVQYTEWEDGVISQEDEKLVLDSKTNFLIGGGTMPNRKKN